MQGTEATPWWGKAHVRLIVLLALLAGVAAYGVPRIVHRFNGASDIVPCVAVHIGTQPLWSLAKLNAVVSASGLPALVGDGTVDDRGLQVPDAAWTDRYPMPKSSPDPAITPSGGGYEIRWWSLDNDHQGADLFAFSTASDAARYVRTAATTNCRRNATVCSVRQPAGGRAVIFTNAVAALQADVLFARGTRVYVTSEVPPIGTRLPPRQLIAIPAGMACELRDAGCT